MSRKCLMFLSLIVFSATLFFPVKGAGQLYRIAVLPFDDGSIQKRWWGDYELGKGVSNELVTALLETKKFRLVEREQVDKILGEQKFSNIAGDQKTAAAVGKILGVKYLVVGRVTEFTVNSQSQGFLLPKLGLAIKSTVARVAIDARMVDTTTAEIIASATGADEKSNSSVGIATTKGGMVFGSKNFDNTDLGQALRGAVNQVAEKLAVQAYEGETDKPITGLVAYTSPTKVIINLGNNDNIEVGMIFEVQHVSDVVKDPVSGEVIDEISDTVAEISVIEVKEKSSVCKIISSPGAIAIADKVKSKMEQNSSPNPNQDSTQDSPPTPIPSSAPDSNPSTGKGASGWL